MRLTASKLPGQIIKQLLPAYPPAEPPAAAGNVLRAGSTEPAAEGVRAGEPSAAHSSNPNQPAALRQQAGEGGSAASAAQPGPYGSLVDKEAQRVAKFERILLAPIVDLAALRDASWSGIPAQYRSVAWQVLLGYLPANRETRASTLQRKRREYSEAVPQFFDVADADRSEHQRAILHQASGSAGRGAAACALSARFACRGANLPCRATSLACPRPSCPPSPGTGARADLARRAAHVQLERALPAQDGAALARAHPLHLGAAPPGERIRAG